MRRSYAVELKRDENGYGLHVGNTTRGICVMSFRRLSPMDRGPAECSRQIQVGDVLVQINQEPICTIHQVHELLQDTTQSVFHFSTAATASTGSSITGYNDDTDQNQNPCPKPPVLLSQPSTSVLLYDLKEQNEALRQQLQRHQIEKSILCAKIEALHEECQRLKFETTRSHGFLPFRSTRDSSSEHRQSIQSAVDECRTQTILEMKQAFIQEITTLKMLVRQYIDDPTDVTNPICPILAQLKVASAAASDD